MDLDLRLLRYFTVVAECGTFHRAAEVLHTAQPSLSRQIRQLEKRLGVQLFERTRHGSHLTAAGQVFLPEARELLLAAERAASRARAAEGPSTLVIGYTGNLVVTPAVRELRRRGCQVSTKHLLQRNVRPALLDGRVDVAVTRLPLPTGQLSVTVLYEHPRVLVVPRSHRLAGKDAVVLEDFAEEPLVRSADPEMDAFWCIDPRPDGRPAPAGPIAETTADKLELVAGGDALTMAPPGDAHTSLRPDLTAVPVHGVEPCRVVIARLSDRSTPPVEQLRAVAASLLRPA